MNLKIFPFYLAIFFVVISPSLVAKANSGQTARTQDKNKDKPKHPLGCIISTQDGCGSETNDDKPQSVYK